MSNVKVIGDPGSCHLGSKTRAKELIDAGKEAGLAAVKFQLFPEAGCGKNIHMPYEWMPELVDYGKCKKIEVFASVFDPGAYHQLLESEATSIKFAYGHAMGMWASAALERFDTVYFSGDMLKRPPEGTVSLYCIPEYPVKYTVDYDSVFEIFDGFSDHTLGYHQTIAAVKAGSKYIEKHYCLGDEKGRCPDSLFALDPGRLHAMCSSIRYSFQG